MVCSVIYNLFSKVYVKKDIKETFILIKWNIRIIFIYKNVRTLLL